MHTSTVTAIQNNTLQAENCRIIETHKTCGDVANFIFTGILGTLISLMGVSCNIISILALIRIKQNAQTMFLLTSLAVYDSVHLIGFLMNVPVFEIAWFVGSKNLLNTQYLYVEAYFTRIFHRTTAGISYWVTSLLTIHRSVQLSWCEDIRTGGENTVHSTSLLSSCIGI